MSPDIDQGLQLLPHGATLAAAVGPANKPHGPRRALISAWWVAWYALASRAGLRHARGAAAPGAVSVGNKVCRRPDHHHQVDGTDETRACCSTASSRTTETWCRACAARKGVASASPRSAQGKRTSACAQKTKRRVDETTSSCSNCSHRATDESNAQRANELAATCHRASACDVVTPMVEGARLQDSSRRMRNHRGSTVAFRQIMGATEVEQPERANNGRGFAG